MRAKTTPLEILQLCSLSYAVVCYYIQSGGLKQIWKSLRESQMSTLGDSITVESTVGSGMG